MATGSTYTISIGPTTADQEAALNYLLTVLLNASGQPYANTTAMLTGILVNALISYIQQHKQAQQSVVSSAMNTATAVQISQIATILGVTLP